MINYYYTSVVEPDCSASCTSGDIEGSCMAPADATGDCVSSKLCGNGCQCCVEGKLWYTYIHILI